MSTMNEISQEREDMDDDDHDSDKNLGSSNDDTDSDSAESVSGDEELDEDECDRRKAEITNEMSDLEKQFLAVREQLYFERLNQIEIKLAEAAVEKSPEYLLPFIELQEALRVREDVAEIVKKLRIDNVQCQYDAENFAAKQTFDMESRQLKEQIRQDLEEKLKRLEEDRISIDSELWGESQLKKKRRYTNSFAETGPLGKDQLNLPDRRRKPVSVSGPYVVYMLKEQDIMEDYNIIRKASKSPASFYYF